MPRTDVESAPVRWHAHDVAKHVLRVVITGRVEADDAHEVDRLLRTSEDRAAVILLDLRAAPMTPALRAAVRGC